MQRLVVRLIDAPLPLRPRFAPPAGTIVITDDGQGTAQELADRLGELDVKTVLVRMRHRAADALRGRPDQTRQRSPIFSPAIRDKCGPVSGLIHLLPLAEPPEAKRRAAMSTRGEVAVSARPRPGESTSAQRERRLRRCCSAVTAMGGTMGFGGDLPGRFLRRPRRRRRVHQVRSATSGQK